MKRIALLILMVALAQIAHADVYVLESDGIVAKQNAHATPGNQIAGTPVNAHTAKPSEKHHGIPLNGVHPFATGSQALIDESGLKYFINTNITFSTSSSASGAMSEASYTHSVAATTLNGGTTSSQLNDAFDGYDAVCISLSGTLAACQTGNADQVIYDKNGPATTECNGRTIVFPTQTINGVAVPAGNNQTSGTNVAPSPLMTLARKVYVPTDDTFARTLNTVTNISLAPITVALMTSNNLGSDNNTVITATSTGSLTASTADSWITSFQNYSGTTTSDPRLGHIIQGTHGVTTPVAALFFQNGSDRPWWGYTITLNPGQTQTIMNFVTGQPSKAAAAATAARLAGLPSTTLECMSQTEKLAVTNFLAIPPAPPAVLPSLSPVALIWLALGLGLVGGLFTLRRRA